MSAKTATTKPAEEKKEFNLERACVLWIYKKEQGKKYLSGRTEDGVKLIGFFTGEKQNPKEPDIKLYVQVEKGEKLGDPYLSLWVNATKKGKKVLSGKLNGKWIVGFFNDKATINGVIPYINVYFQEEKEAKVEASAEDPKQVEFAEIPTDESLPF